MNYATFRKPSRYMGNEVNIIRKKAEIRVALCFPDTYEIGMSHLGLKILYSIINHIPYASAERVFAPWVDYESYIRKNDQPLVSLEYQRPLSGFDIVGFTLQYELSYTNILNMLDLGGLPVRSEERGDEHPLVIAGGPCSVNPLALSPFIDAFVIGDGEEIINEVLDVYSQVTDKGAGGRDREKLLKALSALDGVYVPSVHDTDRQRIRRRFIEDLDKAPFPNEPVVPYTQVIHDRAAIEIARGCAKGCRFCQAGMIYRPVRERSLQNLLALARDSILNTGYEEVSFTSLSSGDYSGLLPLIRDFNRLCRGLHTSISLPSLRVGSISSEMLKEIKSIKKTGFTIAPEAGTKRLRDVINKDFTDEEYDETLKKLFREGWKNVKLYFMIGLPGEDRKDIDGLIDMAVRALKTGREITGGRVNVNVGISSFVPKPHTPFQWVGQNAFAELREKQDHIRNVFKKRRINFKGQHVENSLLEAVFSRADGSCAPLLEEAWKLGCRFDGWSEHLNFQNWQLAADKTGIDLYNYAARSYDLEDGLPWDFIDTGITKKFLQSEYRKALKETITRDCRSVCSGCGLECDDRTQITEPGTQTTEPGTEQKESLLRGTQHAVITKYRVKFSKTGSMRYLSHQELMTAFIRALKRAGIPVAFSAGFHPHPKIAFGPALPSGVEGLSEYFDIELAASRSAADFIREINSRLPEGLAVLNAVLVPARETSLNELISCYEYEIVIDNAMGKHIHSFINLQKHEVRREKKTVDIRPMIEWAEIRGNVLHLRIVDTDGARARLFEILQEMLQMSADEVPELMVKRVGLYGYNRAGQINKGKLSWPEK